jgi:hypothetical protein
MPPDTQAAGAHAATAPGTLANPAARYKPLEYALALAVTAGCTIFLMTGPSSSGRAHGGGAPGGGGLLVRPGQSPQPGAGRVGRSSRGTLKAGGWGRLCTK